MLRIYGAIEIYLLLLLLLLAIIIRFTRLLFHAGVVSEMSSYHHHHHIYFTVIRMVQAPRTGYHNRHVIINVLPVCGLLYTEAYK